MSLKIKINTDFFEKEAGLDREVLVGQLNNVVEQMSVGLNLEKLDALIFPDDFGAEVISFQKGKGIREGFTDNQHGTAIGKTLSYLVDQELRFTIFINYAVIAGLFLEEQKQRSANVIHHELGHVHDDTIKEKMMGTEFILKESGDLQTVLRLHANVIWSEFKATELSTGTKLIQDINILHAFEMIEKVKSNIDNEISKYRVNGDIKSLFGIIQLEASDLLKQFAYILGDMIGKQIQDTEAMEVLSEQINKTHLHHMWSDLIAELIRLNKKYGEWEGVKELDNLSQIVMKVWNIFGIYPEPNWYISVPEVNPLDL